MKQSLYLFFLVLIPYLVQAQLAPFVDFNNYFRTFYVDAFRQIEFQAVRSFEASDQLIAYIDNRGDFKVYTEEQVLMLSNQIVKYKLGDFLLAYNIGPTLFTLKGKQKVVLTTFANRYEVSDSLLVYEDTRYNTLNLRHKHENRVLYQGAGEVNMPVAMGDNILVFKDNGEFYKFYWNDSIYDFAVYNKAIQFSAGRDLLCFNDPINQSFTVFDRGQLLDLESIMVRKFKAGRGFVVYEDIQGNLMYYANGEKQQLSSYGSEWWEATDDLVVWAENSYVYTLDKGQKKQILNFTPEDKLIKNEIFAFKNFMGGVSVYADGKVSELTKQLNASFRIYGNTVLVGLFNKSYIIYYQGKTYEP